jgi:hypothetical protein
MAFVWRFELEGEDYLDVLDSLGLEAFGYLQ